MTGVGGNERDGYELESHWCYFVLSQNPLCSLCCFPAGKWVRHIVAQNASAASQTFDEACDGVVGEEWKGPAALLSWVSFCFAVWLLGMSVFQYPQTPACSHAALEHFLSVLCASLPCQEVYSAVGKTTGILSFTVVSWQSSVPMEATSQMFSEVKASGAGVLLCQEAWLSCSVL